MRTDSIVSIAAAVVMLSTAVAAADEAPSPSLARATESRLEAPEPASSLNLSALGYLAGSYALTYERLFRGGHGVIVEGNLAYHSSSAGEALSYGGGVGYRWHWQGRQNSGFLGVMVARSVGHGEITVATSGDAMTHDMELRSTTVTANIGKRWMLTPAVNITFRIGLGYGSYRAETASTSPDARRAVELMDSLVRLIPIGFDGELSVGYTF